MFQDVLFPTKNLSDDAPFALKKAFTFIPSPLLKVHNIPWVVFDLETTGLSSKNDDIIEIGARRYEHGQCTGEFSTFVSTKLIVSEKITQLTGITQAMLEGQPELKDVLPQFLAFIGGSLLIAHNASFDAGFIKSACKRHNIEWQWPIFCTLKLARELLPELPNKKLDSLAEHYNLTFEARHRSIGDVKVTAAVLQHMLEQEGEHLQTWADFSPFKVE
jgi:DNA polymerase III epsilon subunit family exonuclease